MNGIGKRYAVVYVYLNGIGNRYAVVYETICETNIPNIGVELFEHTQEGADTLIILHALDVTTNDPFNEITVCHPDTDVFLLLIYFYPSLCNITWFQTGNKTHLRNIDVGKAYECLGTERGKAILGFHSFTVSVFTSKFNSKSKLSCWRCFCHT